MYYLQKKYSGGYFALEKLDKKLEKYVDYDNGYFVELGANDGIYGSNSLYFELKRNWSGVLVEPSLNNVLNCHFFRGQKTDIYCNACVSFDYKDKFVPMIYADLMSVSTGVETDLLNLNQHLDDAKQFLVDKKTGDIEFGAVARTLHSILVESKAPSLIDFLSLDVEGAEVEVLKGIDFNCISFKYILIETRDFEKTNRFLESHNYILREQFSESDYLFENCNEMKLKLL